MAEIRSDKYDSRTVLVEELRLEMARWVKL
jgi:hypothetical protein